MFCMSYFEELQADFSEIGLGLGHMEKWPIEMWRYSNLVELMQATNDINGRHKEILARKELNLRTPLGRTALHFLNELNYDFYNGQFGSCGWAEIKLVRNVLGTQPYDEVNKPPVILTNQGRAVGVIKGEGEDSCYGLVDDPESGIFAGVISGHSEEALVAPESDHAWEVPVDFFRDGFHPIRFAITKVPVRYRQALLKNTGDFGQQAALATRHSYLVKRVNNLYKTALPLPEPAYY